MKSIDKRMMMIATSTLVVGLLLGWLLFGGSKQSSGDPHAHETEVSAATIWTCSMHPQIRQSEPGDCPICGMDLIPLEHEEESDVDPMAISMSATAMQLANVRTAFVGKMNPIKEVRLNGKVQPDERLVFSQSSHIPGRIEKLLVNFTGEFVQKGQSIVSVYSPDLITAQKELLEAQKIKDTQPQLFEAAKEKLNNWKLSRQQIEGILVAGIIQEEFPIKAEVSGYVTKKNIHLGDYVMKGTALYEIANLSKVWILFDVYESEIPWIKRGDKVKFTVSSLPGESFGANITYVDPVIDPTTRVAKARIEFNNTNGKLKPEMFVSGTVEANLRYKTQALGVPKTAVMWTGKRSAVYIKNETEQRVSFIMREVTLGASLGDSYIIESGLEEGDEIAVNGTFSIDAAAQLAGKPSMMSPEGGQAVTGHQHGDTNQEGSNVNNNPALAKAITPTTISAKAKQALQPLYTDYLNLKDNLVADNFASAKKSAVAMQTHLSKVDMQLFTGESHNAWMKFSKGLSGHLKHASHFTNIEEVRASFQQLSIIMIQLSESFHPFSRTLYVQHCPMADDNKGADWLSLEKEIKNPYFGASMLSCGDVTKEIK